MCPPDDDRPSPTDDTPKRQVPADEEGLSLDELSAAYADALQEGEDPYAGRDLDKADRAEPTGDDDREPTEGDNCVVTPRSILEAMLFVGRPDNGPLTGKQVAALMRGVHPREIDELVRQLNRLYEAQQAPYVIQSVGAGYRMVLRDELHRLRQGFYGRVKDARLSQSAIDVLAVVAYHQPVSRPQIDNYRGRESGRLLRQLVRRDLLRIDRSDEPPRTAHYATTDRFLELFSLQGLDDLPHSQELETDP